MKFNKSSGEYGYVCHLLKKANLIKCGQTTGKWFLYASNTKDDYIVLSYLLYCIQELLADVSVHCIQTKFLDRWWLRQEHKLVNNGYNFSKHLIGNKLLIFTSIRQSGLSYEKFCISIVTTRLNGSVHMVYISHVVHYQIITTNLNWTAA